MNYNADFFDRVTLRLCSIIKKDISLIPDLLEHGKGFIMSWLKDVSLRKQFENDAVMYYYNVAWIAFAGGVAYADAWQKDITQIKLGTVDTLLTSQNDLAGLAMDILGLDGDKQVEYRQNFDSMFSEFLQLMAPYWNKEDPRPFLFQGLLAFFTAGVSLKID